MITGQNKYADEMKGFSGSESCGVRIKNAHVKGRFDVVILGFANDREKNMFVSTVSNSLQPAAPEVRIPTCRCAPSSALCAS